MGRLSIVYAGVAALNRKSANLAENKRFQTLLGRCIVPATVSSLFPIPESQPPITTFSFGGYADSAQGLKGVSFWPRVGARVIDLIIHYIVGAFSMLLMGFMVGVAAAATHQPAGIIVHKMLAGTASAYLLAMVGALGYHTVCDAVHGSTLGKLIFSMTVVQEDGSPCRFKSAFIRNLAYFLDALFFGLVGYYAMKRDDTQQRYGDQWAHTIVCRKGDLPPEARRDGGRFLLGLLLACMADSAVIIGSLAIRLMA